MTATADKLATTLDANPDLTTAQLAITAGIGFSTTGKILAAWEKDGAAFRTTPEKGAATWRNRARVEAARAAIDAAFFEAEVAPEPAANGKRVLRADRLTSGGLRGMVEDWLTDNADREITPSKLGKILDRSAGAVHNACERLVEAGVAVRTSDRPKTYRLAAE